ncbi:hypothetical protein [Singulisphaera sp. GP187]|uniref:hypothetical protein n=1 Tax=Singulisphaera sp. GP187 TaxID=1882752 RepID=UPI0009414D1A|nr:hypothetical protein [Singulisphaera sp. GP187]
MLTITRRPCSTRLLWLIPLLALAGCGGGEPVTKQSIAQARKVWARARIDDYDLDWTSSGTNNAYYHVIVRDGRVRRLEQVLPDGRTVELHPGKPEYFGVDGLFLTMAEEHAQLETDRPFGQAKGSKAVLLFTPDPKYGYPQSYRRDVVGAILPVAIDVVRFVPNPPQSQPTLP